MSAVGLTDHGTFAGAIQFLKECRKQSVKPILGCEMYLSRNHKINKSDGQPDGRKGNRHLNVIAKNYEGYKNLCALVQTACVDGYYYDPRIDIELLEKHKSGLIVTSACLSSVVNNNLLHDQYDKAKNAVAIFKDIFGTDFYLEMMFHGISDEAKVLPDIQKLSKEMDVKVILSNDTHYLEKEDAEFHEYVMCISSGRTVNDPKRIKYPYDEFYFKSAEEMYQMFNHVPSYMVNTLEIAEKCDYSDLVFVEDGGDIKLPKFVLPEGFYSPHDYLEHLGKEGLKRCGLDKSPRHVERVKRELGDLRLVWDTKRYDFATYFLMVEDIMRFAKDNKIDAGIRGSGYGSLLLKCLGISEGLDPLEYSLFWERFMGFDDARFISEEDLGLKRKDVTVINTETKIESNNAIEIMFDRYS